jgi:hypothetical protein
VARRQETSLIVCASSVAHNLQRSKLGTPHRTQDPGTKSHTPALYPWKPPRKPAASLTTSRARAGPTLSLPDPAPSSERARRERAAPRGRDGARPTGSTCPSGHSHARAFHSRPLPCPAHPHHSLPLQTPLRSIPLHSGPRETSSFSQTLDTPPHRLRREIENVHLYAARDPCSCRHRRRADAAEGASGSGGEPRLSLRRARRRTGGDGRAQVRLRLRPRGLCVLGETKTCNFRGTIDPTRICAGDAPRCQRSRWERPSRAGAEGPPPCVTRRRTSARAPSSGSPPEPARECLTCLLS